MRMQMEYQFIIAYFCERPHSKIKIRPSRLQTLFNLLKILLSVTRITITTGHAYFFSHYCPPQPWEFLVVTQFLCRWTRSTAATLEPYPGIRGFGDPRMPYTYVYVIWGSHNTLSSALLLMPFHMVLNEWHIKFFLFSAAFCFCDIFMNASKCSPSFFLHFYHPPPPSTIFFFFFVFSSVFCVTQLWVYSCGMRRIVFCQYNSVPFLFVIVLPTVQAKTHTHTRTHTVAHMETWLENPFQRKYVPLAMARQRFQCFFRLGSLLLFF